MNKRIIWDLLEIVRKLLPPEDIMAFEILEELEDHLNF